MLRYSNVARGSGTVYEPGSRGGWRERKRGRVGIMIVLACTALLPRIAGQYPSIASLDLYYCDGKLDLQYTRDIRRWGARAGVCVSPSRRYSCVKKKSDDRLNLDVKRNKK